MGENPSGKLEGIPKAIQTADSSFCTHTPLSNNPNHVDENGRNGECTWSTLEESLLSCSSLFQQLSNHLRINSIMGRNPLSTSVHSVQSGRVGRTRTHNSTADKCTRDQEFATKCSFGTRTQLNSAMGYIEKG